MRALLFLSYSFSFGASVQPLNRLVRHLVRSLMTREMCYIAAAGISVKVLRQQVMWCRSTGPRSTRTSFLRFAAAAPLSLTSWGATSTNTATSSDRIHFWCHARLTLPGSTPLCFSPLPQECACPLVGGYWVLGPWGYHSFQCTAHASTSSSSRSCRCGNNVTPVCSPRLPFLDGT